MFRVALPELKTGANIRIDIRCCGVIRIQIADSCFTGIIPIASCKQAPYTLKPSYYCHLYHLSECKILSKVFDDCIEWNLICIGFDLVDENPGPCENNPFNAINLELQR